MRQIKFRAWDKDEENFIENWEKDFWLIEYFGFDGSDRFIIQQFTGLKDKNGKEIYEGDIVKDRIYPDENPQKLSEEYKVDRVKVVEFVLGDIFQGYTISENVVEIIGNIYENPELIK